MNNIDIKQILEQFPDCITNGEKLKGILLDTYPGISKAVVDTLVIIVNSGIAAEIKSNSNVTELEKSRWKKKLEDDDGLSEKVIESCLNLFLHNSTTCQKSNTSNKSNSTVNTKSTTAVSDSTTTSTKSSKSASNDSRLRQVSQNIKIGSTIKFGAYWQGANKSDGKTPIEWKVLAKDGNKALVISEKALDCQQYNTSYISVNWETCSLRKWLNGTFLNAAFSEEEQNHIQNTYVVTDENPTFNTSGGNATTDKVFLLSIYEANKYFASDEARKCVPTEFAKANGTYTYDGYCLWWLRSLGYNQDYASCVLTDGDVYYYGSFIGDDKGCRPALWIDLSMYKSDNTTCATTTTSVNTNNDSEQNIQNVTVGNIIKFGSYWQGKNKSEGKTPIEWRVLAKDGNKALVISEKALDCQQYNTSSKSVIWGTCSLRKWLNGTFLNAAFSAQEKKHIQSTYVSADKNPYYNINPGNATTDKVFLLSLYEVRNYLRSFENRKCVPTAYAKANGAKISKNLTKNGEPTCFWWMRSPGYDQNSADAVGTSGVAVGFCGLSVFDAGSCVRPALWIDLSMYESDDTIIAATTTTSANSNSGSKQCIQNITVGSIIKFGAYWQGKNKSEGKTPIEWRVLAKDANKALVISEKALDCKKYTTNHNIGYSCIGTWGNCTLRRWLNNDFLNNAFSIVEQTAIQSTCVTADSNPKWGSNPDSATKDNIFLLSIDEANKYFKSDEDRKSVPTAYAKEYGAYTYDDNTKNGELTCWWWLRAPGNSDAVCVNHFGYVILCDYCVSYDSNCVRPALWIDLSAINVK